MKIMGRKKSQQLLSKDTEPNNLHKRWKEKNSQVSKLDTSMSHQDLVISNYHHFRVSSE